MLQICLFFKKYNTRLIMKNSIVKNDFFTNYKELFPTKMSFIVFISYMALFINQGNLFFLYYYQFINYLYIYIFIYLGLLVTASKNGQNSFNYNPITVVLLTELLKLIISTCIYLKK